MYSPSDEFTSVAGDNLKLLFMWDMNFLIRSIKLAKSVAILNEIVTMTWLQSVHILIIFDGKVVFHIFFCVYKRDKLGNIHFWWSKATVIQNENKNSHFLKFHLGRTKNSETEE